MPRNSEHSDLSNRYQSGPSYQSSHNYQPPSVSGTYAQQQTQIMEDTMRTNYEAANTVGNVLSQMHGQRQQLTGAHENVWEMRQAAEKAKKDLTSMVKQARKKKLKLQIIAAGLAFIDFVLFLRLLKCGGSFFCKNRGYNNNYYN